MAVPLNEELERKIFEDLQSAFSDFQFFDNLKLFERKLNEDIWVIVNNKKQELDK